MSHLRMFAGPNGPGKSTLKGVLPPALLGVYVNPDDLEAAARSTGTLDLGDYGIAATEAEVRGYLSNSEFLRSAGLADACSAIRVVENTLDFGALPINSYRASVLSDFLRRKLLRAGATFSFETVMSSPDKVELLREARGAGYRTYLYFVATEDPAINVSRVAGRVRLSGHGVPADKIVARYHRSLGLLREAIRASDRAYLFDNTGSQLRYAAEVTAGSELVIHSAPAPNWLATALDQL